MFLPTSQLKRWISIDRVAGAQFEALIATSISTSAIRWATTASRGPRETFYLAQTVA